MNIRLEDAHTESLQIAKQRAQAARKVREAPIPWVSSIEPRPSFLERHKPVLILGAAITALCAWNVWIRG